MTCGPTDEEMTVNLTAKENDALQTLHYQSSWEPSNPSAHTRQLGCYRPSQSSKSCRANVGFQNKMQSYRLKKNL